MPQLKRLHLENYRSIQNADIEFGRLNVLIGANGSGKSNLISFFKMMNEMIGGRLQQYIATTGRAQSILHFGPKVSSNVDAIVDFESNEVTYSYAMALLYSIGDTLLIAREVVTKVQSSFAFSSNLVEAGLHLESTLRHPSQRNIAGKTDLCSLMEACRVFHFHDTTPTARIRQYCFLGDNHSLLPDAANLAAMLLRFRNRNEKVYYRIVKAVQLVAPYFDDFVLEPSAQKDLLLNWRQRGTDLTFGPHQLSDGTLRAICLISLLLQPVEDLPLVIIVDEPELGLHPYALNVIASLFKAASEHVQVIISTQSSTFLDHFDPDDVIVVDQRDGKSTFHRPGAEKLDAWLEEYSLGEIWEKNVIGGGPH